jgi:CheY-like chemotaxis protein
VVDDNLNVRELLGTVLERMGLRVIFAEDGHQCLQTLRQDGVDLVLIDLRLPGLDGLEVVRRIRKGWHCASVPIIALTGYSHVQTRESALAGGCQAFLAKPFSLNELRQKVAELLGLSFSPPGPGSPPPDPTHH